MLYVELKKAFYRDTPCSEPRGQETAQGNCPAIPPSSIKANVSQGAQDRIYKLQSHSYALVYRHPQDNYKKLARAMQ